MILEGLVTTLDPGGRPHLAPMGPRVEGPGFQSFLLRPFPTSQSYQNLMRHSEGVLHITDDALLIARAAVGKIEVAPAMRSAQCVNGYILSDCHRFFEFRVTDVNTSAERVAVTAEVVHAGHGARQWFGFNRARHAVVEAAILASRVHILPREQLHAEMRLLFAIVSKTGGPDEHLAMDLLLTHVHFPGTRS